MKQSLMINLSVAGVVLCSMSTPADAQVQTPEELVKTFVQSFFESDRIFLENRGGYFFLNASTRFGGEQNLCDAFSFTALLVSISATSEVRTEVTVNVKLTKDRGKIPLKVKIFSGRNFPLNTPGDEPLLHRAMDGQRESIQDKGTPETAVVVVGGFRTDTTEGSNLDGGHGGEGTATFTKERMILIAAGGPGGSVVDRIGGIGGGGFAETGPDGHAIARGAQSGTTKKPGNKPFASGDGMARTSGKAHSHACGGRGAKGGRGVLGTAAGKGGAGGIAKATLEEMVFRQFVGPKQGTQLAGEAWAIGGTGGTGGDGFDGSATTEGGAGGPGGDSGNSSTSTKFKEGKPNVFFINEPQRIDGGIGGQGGCGHPGGAGGPGGNGNKTFKNDDPAGAGSQGSPGANGQECAQE